MDKFEAGGEIEPSRSLWCHPVVIVEKKNGEHRFTLVLAKLNDIVPLMNSRFQKWMRLLGV